MIPQVSVCCRITSYNVCYTKVLRSFSFFEVWHGSKGSSDFDAANPDNLLIDHEGGVGFGTDGNFGTNSRADSVYYLDLV